MVMKATELDKDVGDGVQGNNCLRGQLAQHQKSVNHSRRQESKENKSSNALSSGQSNSNVIEQGRSPVDESGIDSEFIKFPAPPCRQFWKAGDYDDGPSSKLTLQNGKNYLHVHPIFLHSNATSHKWVFGAIAELVDNAVDEIQNGASFVIVDKISNPRDGSPALLIQDDGGGMDPEAIRRCMSFGFSDKKSKSAIGQYGNGFKTSTMRLGADAIVFSRHADDRVLTQSIGLLSFTFLTQTGHDRIVVPMVGLTSLQKYVDYELNTAGNLEILDRYGKEYFMSNLSLLLQWSPYSTEAELLKQFEDIGLHGTKVIVYNLWFNDDGNVELDFDTDPEDIRINGDIKEVQTRPAWRTVNEEHISNRLRYSLRAYLSILYLRIPENFTIVLRGKFVKHHNLALDLKFQEFIVYRPQSSGCIKGELLTTIGFLKEAPQVTVHGFNIYHKNRLILPFWSIVNYGNNSRSRGVVGVLEANFVEPTHDKQDFERTSLFQKLEVRLKEMTWEYWDYHCGLIGYQVTKKLRPTEPPPDSPVGISTGSDTLNHGLSSKRKEHCDLDKLERIKRQAGTGANAFLSGHGFETEVVSDIKNKLEDQDVVNLIQVNKNFRAKCLDYKKRTEDLDLKVTRLRSELGQARMEYEQLMVELTS
ncbi:PREDICTED: MORC family CW-type zinc finger protein 3-like isoform X2 [Populus euphratica]|uniref:MORC family CW-type zinc finger protein 3-like isoform X2 n=1 Tax=Populus euphratica TaxID=75702 RepID=A0AAJ6VDE9_POPEU|nr:PREDICTED: MORC family CW-type zinc finger protein 3-like isoform X2 [Populus euphratica]